MDKVTYEEICSVQISEARHLVISKCSKGGFTIGQKMIVDDGEKQIEIFLKGAIHINDEKSLESIEKCIKNVLVSLKK